MTHWMNEFDSYRLPFICVHNKDIIIKLRCNILWCFDNSLLRQVSQAFIVYNFRFILIFNLPVYVLILYLNVWI